MEEELARRRKIIKIVFCIVLFAYIIGNWIATQTVANACLYNELLGANLVLGRIHIYPPYGFYLWSHNELLIQAIPHILAENERIVYLSTIAGALFSYFLTMGMKKNISHGSASFATKKDIEKAKLNAKESGVVIGMNPFTHKLMLDNNVTHDLLVAPTRGGKGINTIIPTGLVWKPSIFFFDVKSELWQSTAGYRRDVLHQKVMKFEPLCSDGSTARWNPLAEINFRTAEEFNDVQTIVSILVKPDGEKQGGDPFWDNAGSALLNGVILHLLYQHYKEGKPLPCPTDIMSFLSSPDKDTQELFDDMKVYPHITPEEFLSDHNILQEIYGEYIKNFNCFNDALNCNVHSLNELKAVIKKHDNVDFTEEPFNLLLTHPRVAECASNMSNNAEPTRASIMSTAQTCLALYQNPIVQKNTAVSDFCIKDLLNPSQEISMYFVMQPNDVMTLKPLSRLFINTLLSNLIRDIKYEKDQQKEQPRSGFFANTFLSKIFQKKTSENGKKKKQRLLLMLDEFPQLGCLKKMEQALAVCAGYGIKVCIVSQDVNQLTKEYSKDNSIASNCHTHIYFTPNLSTGSSTAEAISKSLGKKTIVTNSHSDGGGGLFKGSISKSCTSRDLMTPDEVSHMSENKELVFVAGQKPILGNKLKYFEQPFFATKILPEPLYSDTATCIQNYAELFAVHAAESKDRIEKKRLVDKAKIQFLKEVSKENAKTIQPQKDQEQLQKQFKQPDKEFKTTPERAWNENLVKVDKKSEFERSAVVAKESPLVMENESAGTNPHLESGADSESIANKKAEVGALMDAFLQKHNQEKEEQILPADASGKKDTENDSKE